MVTRLDFHSNVQLANAQFSLHSPPPPPDNWLHPSPTHPTHPDSLRRYRYSGVCGCVLIDCSGARAVSLFEVRSQSNEITLFCYIKLLLPGPVRRCPGALDMVAFSVISIMRCTRRSLMMHLVYSSEQHQVGNFKKKTSKPTNTALSFFFKVLILQPFSARP